MSEQHGYRYCEAQHGKQWQNEIVVDTVVIGNGPSGITMSYMLSGWTPHYQQIGLPDHDMISLKFMEQNHNLPITDMCLQQLSEGLEGRSINPVSVLFDQLSHPYADIGLDIPSQIQWTYQKDRAVSHVVIGKSPKPGGVWQKILSGIKTLSKASWMELPNLTFKDFILRKRKADGFAYGISQQRATAQDVRDYYEYYVDFNKLSDNFLNNSVVTSVQQISNSKRTIDADTGELELQTTEMVWEVRGYYLDAEINHQEKDFCFRCRNVVLACGTSDKPNRLQVCGEDLSYVNHHIPNMEEFMKNVNSMDSDPVLVIGAGLSAADAILTAKQFKLNVIHLFRQSLRQQKNRLPKSIYPDYNYMYELMSGTEKADWYKSYSNHSVRCFLRNNKVLLEDDSGHMEIIEVSAVLVQIGSTVNFDFLSDQGRNIGIVPGMTIDAKHNRIDINPYTHECNTVQGLYALGPLVGDNFVRFLKGGALAITKHILMKNGVISM